MKDVMDVSLAIEGDGHVSLFLRLLEHVWICEAMSVKGSSQRREDGTVGYQEKSLRIED